MVCTVAAVGVGRLLERVEGVEGEWLVSGGSGGGLAGAGHTGHIVPMTTATK